MTETASQIDYSSINIFLSLASGLIGAVLAIIGAFGVRSWEERKRLNSIKETIRLFLLNDILVNIDELKSEYQKCIDLVPVYNRKNVRVSAFEGFNYFIYRANKPEDHYKIYKDKFLILNQIFSIINFLSGNLPLKIMNDFTYDINKHLNEENDKGKILKGEERRNHFNTCPQCKTIQERFLFSLQLRLDECNKLSLKIKELLELEVVKSAELKEVDKNQIKLELE